MEIQPGIDIYLGDCLEVMNDIPDHSVDAVICDPPYGTTSCEWDSVIPLEPLWAHYKRIIKPRGAVVLTASQPFTTTLIASNMAWFKYCWYWDKANPTGFLNAKKQPLRVVEEVAVFAEGQTTYNPQMELRGSPRKKGGYIKGTGTENYGDFRSVSSVNNEYYPTNLLPITNANRSEKEHPTQKPVALMEYLIKTYTNPGELVLDNTMGSGTTGIACIRTNRRFIGIEKDPEIFQTAKDRLSGGKPRLAVIGDTMFQQAKLF